MSELRTSEAGLKLIMAHEGFRSVSKQLPDGRWVIGYGHMKAAREGLKISQAEAEAILREFDLPPIEKGLNDLLLVPVSQNEFDALTSFAFNIGLDQFEASDVLAHINAGNKLKAAWAMESWRKARVGARDMVVDPLVRRRADEKALFLKTGGPVPLASSSRFRPLVDIEETERYRKQAAQRGYQAPGYPANDQTDDETSAEAAARTVKERLTRILGEDGDEDDDTLEGEIDTDLEMVTEDEKSVEDIRKAVSALAVNAPGHSEEEEAGEVEDGFLVMSADNDAGEAGEEELLETPSEEGAGEEADAHAAEAEPAEEEASEQETQEAQPSAIDLLVPPAAVAAKEDEGGETPVEEEPAAQEETETAPQPEAADEKSPIEAESAETGSAEAESEDQLSETSPEADETDEPELPLLETDETDAEAAEAGEEPQDAIVETDAEDKEEPAEDAGDEAPESLPVTSFEGDPKPLEAEEEKVVRDERGRVIIDDLRPSDVWLSDGSEREDESKEGPLETLVFGLLALIGAGLFAYGGGREFGWFGLETASQSEMMAYMPPFLMLLGGLVFIVMAYYCVKAVFSKN